MITLLFALLAPAPAPEPVTLLRCASLFDGTTLRRDVDVLVRGGTIAAVGPGLSAPEGAQVVDLRAGTVMPGLIDAHTHLVLHPGGFDEQILKESPEYRALAATVSARATLEAGITTVRDLGNEGAGVADLALRDAVARGLVPGPRMLAAIQPVVPTGAYRLTGFAPHVATPPIALEADGEAGVRRAVRTLVAQGADVLKLYVESYEKKSSDPEALSGAFTYTPAELAAAADEAHAAGVKVAAHVYSDEGGRRALAAGVDSIEHGLYLSEATLREMAARKIAYVPTLLVYELWRDGKIFAPVPEATRKRLAVTVERHTATFQAALRSGVRIVFGSDTFELPGTNAGELELMGRYGMPPLDVLRAATSSAAELLGLRGQVGTLAPGAAADLVAYETDVTRDLSRLVKPAFVMKAGRIVLGGR